MLYEDYISIIIIFERRSKTLDFAESQKPLEKHLFIRFHTLARIFEMEVYNSAGS